MPSNSKLIRKNTRSNRCAIFINYYVMDLFISTRFIMTQYFMSKNPPAKSEEKFGDERYSNNEKTIKTSTVVVPLC